LVAESTLATFKQQRNAWQQCAEYMGMTTNPNVLWYTLSVFEYVIASKWGAIPETEKTQVREFIFRYATEHHSQVAYVQSKVIKVYADIGKHDWPHAFPQFIDMILGLFQSQETILLGLSMLQTTAEEFSSGRGLPARRAEELVQLLKARVPMVFTTLMRLLDTSYAQAHGEAAKRAIDGRMPTNLGLPSTPRSSPTPGMRPIVMAPQAVTPTLEAEFHEYFRFQDEKEKMIAKSLECICQFFTWVDLSEMVTPHLLSTLFNFAQLKDLCNGEIGATAMSCFNEMLSRNCVPANFDEYLLKMFQLTVELLRRVTAASGKEGDKNPLVDLADGYNDKFTEFLSLFVSGHFRRVEQNPSFAIDEFLQLLFRFTFLQPEPENFAHCLDVCDKFIDIIIGRMGSADFQGSLARYRDCLLLLGTELLKKIRFKFNGTSLIKLDNVETNDDLMTELQEHVSDCTNVIVEIAKLYPHDIVGTAVAQFIEHADVFLRIHENVAGEAGQVPRLTFRSVAARQTIYVMCRDLITSTQVVGKLAFYFTEDFAARLDSALGFMERLVGLLRYSDQHKLYLVDALLAEVHAEALMAVKALSYWITEFGRVAQGHGTEAIQRFRAIVTAVIELSLLPFHLPAGLVALPIVSQAAAQLLHTVTSQIRPGFLLEVPCLVDSVKRGGGICSALEPTTRLAVVTSLSNALLLPAAGVPQASINWEPRAAQHRELIGGLLGGYIGLQSQPEFAAGQLPAGGEACIKDACTVLSALAKSVREQPVVTKDVLVKTLTPLFPSTLLLLRIMQILSGNKGVLELVLQMFLDFFEGIGTRLEGGFIQQTVDSFLAVFTPDQLTVLVAPDGGGNLGVVKFLQILAFFVQDRGKTFKRYLPEIVSLCIERIYPIVADLPTVTIRLALFGVLKHVMLENWRYFYPMMATADSLMSGGASGGGGAVDTLANQAQFLAIMQAICVSLRQPDINQFKTNLATLQELNHHKKLYQKEFFRMHILAVLLEILFGSLVTKSHDLLSEEILSAVHDLAAVDFAAFFSVFLPQLLAKTTPLTDEQRSELAAHFTGERDIPTFTRNVSVFVNDLILFQQSNAP
jgi:hypothetical protein